jgi:hypothetical protein
LFFLNFLPFNFDFHAVKSSENEKNPVLDDFNTILYEIEKRSYDLIPLPNWFYIRFTSSGRKFSKCINNRYSSLILLAVTALKSVVSKIVQKRRKHDQRVGDLLDLMMDSESVDTMETLSDEEIGGEVMTFLVFVTHNSFFLRSLVCWTW